VRDLVDNKCKSSDITGIKCEELENKLQETLLELSSGKLIIKLLQKEINTNTASACTATPNIDSGSYKEHEVPNDNDWIPVTSGHSYEMGNSTKYTAKYEKQPIVQHIVTFNCFAPLATQYSSNSAQTCWEVCTPKQTVNYVNHSNKGNNRFSNPSSMSHNITYKQGIHNINHQSKLTSVNKVNVVSTVPRKPKIVGSVVPVKTGGTRNIAKKKKTIAL